MKRDDAVRRDLKNLLNRAAAALQAADDMEALDLARVIEDLTVAGEKIDGLPVLYYYEISDSERVCLDRLIEVEAKSRLGADALAQAHARAALARYHDDDEPDVERAYWLSLWRLGAPQASEILPEAVSCRPFEQLLDAVPVVLATPASGD